MRSFYKATVLFVYFSVLAACKAVNVMEEWPEDMPVQEHFISIYKTDPDNQQVQTIEDYLSWVVSFYQGSLLSPMGWNDMSSAILSGMGDEEFSRAARLREQLGLLIAAEWAKDNNVRIIDTALLSLWGEVMVTASNPADRLRAMELILADVQGLLEKTVRLRTLNEQHYEQRLGIELES
jgi:hypothetical protein